MKPSKGRSDEGASESSDADEEAALRRQEAAGRALAALVQTPEEKLKKFRKKWIPEDAPFDLERFHQARRLLDAVADALLLGDEWRWQQLRVAFDALVAASEPEEEPELPPPAAPPAAEPLTRQRVEARAKRAFPPEPASLGPLRAADRAPPPAPEPRPEPSPAGPAIDTPSAPPKAARAGSPVAPTIGKPPPQSFAPSPWARGADEEAVADDSPAAGPPDDPDRTVLPFRQARPTGPNAGPAPPTDPLLDTVDQEPTLRMRKTTPDPRQGDPSFVDDLVPVGPTPKPPDPGQSVTHLVGVGQHVTAAQQASRWPVEQYARLCAELRGRPEDAEEIYAAYGLRAQMVRSFVEKHWRRRFASEPGLKERWEELVAQNREDPEPRI